MAHTLVRFGDEAREGGIIDPVKVVHLALQNAASVAGMLITTQVLVIDAPEKLVGRAQIDDFAA